ncbi:MAG: hypothetical protein KJ607_14035 [Bacteroidetes bacterium]|nr:hypothetical protein [Bacteroidota bacterium]
MKRKNSRNDVCSDENIGFGCSHIISSSTAVTGVAPLIYNDNNIVLVCESKLDNADELYELLDLHGKPIEKVSDIEYFTGAYYKWGEDCSVRILGEWSFAVWDKRYKKIFLSRDHHGNTGMYYYFGKEKFIFATTISSILPFGSLKKVIDRQYLAEILVNMAGHNDNTSYADIKRLLPAHSLVLSNGQIKTGRYWFPENTPKLEYRNNQEYIEAFNEKFQIAVHRKTNGQRKVGCALSGGLDSGSVAVTARRVLMHSGRKLVAYTATPAFNAENYLKKYQIADEKKLVGEIGRMYPDIELRFVKNDYLSPVQAINKMLEIHGEPRHAVGNYSWLASILDYAAKDDVTAILTGQGGNGTVSRPTGEFLKYNKKSGILVNKYGLYPYIFSIFHKIFFISSPVSTKMLVDAYYLNPEIIRKYKLEKRFLENAGNKFKTRTDSFNSRLRQMQIGKALVGATWNELGIHYGIDVFDPTVDKELIEFCISIPEDMFYNHKGSRLLIRNSMNGALPDSVLYSDKTGIQSGDIMFHIARNKDEIYELLDKVARSDMVKEFIDIKKLSATYNRIISGKHWKTGTVMQCRKFLKTLAVSAFLYNLKQQ